MWSKKYTFFDNYFYNASPAFNHTPRQTLDADLVLRMLRTHAEPFYNRLCSEFYLDLEAIKSAIANQASFNLIHLESMMKVDLFVRWQSPFAQSQLSRRQKKSLGESTRRELFFASPEDTLLAKLEWYRKGGELSDRQWRDVLGVLKVQGARIDRPYLERWASELKVADLLARALTEAV